MTVALATVALTAAVPGARVCYNKIALSGAPAVYSPCNGVYTSTNEKVGDHSVYKKQDMGQQPCFLYWVPNHGGQWLVDTDTNAKFCSAYLPSQGGVPSCAKKQLVVTGGWAVNGKWTPVQTTLQVNSCDVCSTGADTVPDIPTSLFMGAFVCLCLCMRACVHALCNSELFPRMHAVIQM